MAKHPRVDRFEDKSGHCPGMWKINYVSGCPGSCETCYLDAVSEEGRINSVSTIEAALKAVNLWLPKPTDSAILNTGETGDSWAFLQSHRINYELIRAFDTQQAQLNGSRHSILFLTKSNHAAMLAAPGSDSAIFSFSVNPVLIAEAFNATYVYTRMLKRLSEQGRRIRLRIDPMIPVPGWESAYRAYIERLAKERVCIEMITLGSLRLTDRNYHLRKEQKVALLDFCHRDPEGGMHPWRIHYQTRRNMYMHLLEQCRFNLPDVPVGLCKEPDALRMDLGVSRGVCNCLPLPAKEAKS